ncbi:hypothetical protein DI09_2p530 [Mitosporidium daphniae]|uniref:CRAL-TRIO domain-containing protein n=1 Tax=Mitosporidium daphniae TaxID=1485682 RepID=A0A098VVB5_9MICR|nr:uncharacterized protein DI09_2p530 [Mitosporidium daphniae]KGG51676.1 hypothetical protein DI09_2p530 [Mitosporidium daphniae]|eukprot:XP_013238103.1 uncharacterized protein DI09_2p530 [Mitosporidium daphniae]
MDYAFEAEELETTEVTSCYLEGTLALETKVSSFTQQHRVSTRNLEKNTGGSIVFDNDLEGHVNRITFKQSCMLEKSTCTEEVVDLFRKYVKVPDIKRKSRLGNLFSLPKFENLSLEPDGQTLHVTESEPSMGIEGIEKGTQKSNQKSALNELWLGMLGNFSHPDINLLRFLRARKWSLDEAFKMFVECLYWRWSKDVLSLMRLGESSIPLHLMKSGKTFFHGTDKSGHSLIFVLSKMHDRRSQSEEESENFTIYHMELGRRMLGEGMEKTTIVFDLKDAGYNSLDISSIRHMITCFQSNYPESLYRCYVLNAPWLFWALWKLVSPLLDPVVAAKITFVKRVEDLLNYVDEANIPSAVLSKARPLDNGLVVVTPIFCKSIEKTDIDENHWNEALLASLDVLKKKTLNIASILKDCSEEDFEDKVGGLISQRKITQEEYKKYASGSLLASYAENVYERHGILDHSDPTYLNWNRRLYR